MASKFFSQNVMYALQNEKAFKINKKYVEQLSKAENLQSFFDKKESSTYQNTFDILLLGYPFYVMNFCGCYFEMEYRKNSFFMRILSFHSQMNGFGYHYGFFCFKNEDYFKLFDSWIPRI